MSGRGGYTLVEVIVAATLAVAVIFVASSAVGTMGGAASYGRRRLDTRSENQRCLHFLANDLQNASAGLDPDSTAPRFTLIEDSDTVELVTRTAESLAAGDTAETAPGAPAGDVTGTRPRLERYARNSRFSFRRVVGTAIDPEYGDIVPVWSEPIIFRVENRQLLRIQDGQTRVIGQNVSVFKVFAEADGIFRVFLRTQKRHPETGEVITVSGSIEVNPKN